MKIFIIFFIFFAKAKGNTFSSFPSDILDLEYSSLITKDVKKVSFLLSFPCSLSSFILKHKSFGLIFDGKNFIDLQFDKKILPLYIGGKIGYGKENSLRIGNGFVFSPIKYFSAGINYIFSYSFKRKDYLYVFQSGAFGDLNILKIFCEFSFEKNFENFAYHFGQEMDLPFLPSLKIFSGFMVGEKFYPSFGLQYALFPFDFYISYAENRFFAGLSVDYREKIKIKKITETVEVVKEVPVYVKEKPKESKKLLKVEEKEKELTEKDFELMEFHYKKGIEYYKKDMLEKAIEEWEKVYEIDPGYKDVKKYLEETKEKLKKLKEIE